MAEAFNLPVTQWRYTEGDKDIQDLLARDLGLLPVISQILMSRDIQDLDNARRYLRPSLNDLPSPFLMKDMEKGVRRIIKAIYNQERIMVYGDYDADGITAITVLMKFLQGVTSSVSYYIPDRIEEGYGLNRLAIDRMKAEDVQLIVTVDCGVSDLDEVAYARSCGLDTIILDHHEVPAVIPAADAVINPNRSDCRFPFKHLAGVGIAFNFLIALRGGLRQDGFWNNRTYPNLKDYLDLVALGTIGDISPLIEENRIFTKIGLDLITEDKRVGIKALKEICGIENQVIDSNKASYNLIPRINAAGRIGSPREAVELLMTDDMSEALDLARKLDTYNRKRQAMERTILSEILDDISKTMDPAKKRSLVFASHNWHPGVIGIVASRLVDRFCRPAILISLKDGVGKGSGRSISDFNIYQGLKKCDSLLISYGGHQYAAGISIKEEDIGEFSKLLDEIVEANIHLDDMVSQTLIDAQCQLSDVNHELLTQIAMLAPFGSRNPEPVLCVRNVNITGSNIVGNNHLRMRINGDGVCCNSIWFSRGNFIHSVDKATSDIVFTPQVNVWNGSSEIQLKMKDILINTQ
jgi:single-stranded-DNA-specific exonuclease